MYYPKMRASPEEYVRTCTLYGTVGAPSDNLSQKDFACSPNHDGPSEARSADEREGLVKGLYQRNLRQCVTEATASHRSTVLFHTSRNAARSKMENKNVAQPTGMLSSYQNIVVSVASDDDFDMIETRPSWPLRSKLSLVVLGAIALACVAVLGRSTSAASQQANLLPDSVSAGSTAFLGSAKSTAPACTFHECYASNCNAKVAPYTCLFHNGGPHGGCSPVPWTPETCTQQCDLSNCDSLEISNEVPDCDVECDKDWCDMGRLCGPEVPYQCSIGSSAFGCSADKYTWTLKTASTSCSSCCNINTC
jgi:hypothetical protein